VIRRPGRHRKAQNSLTGADVGDRARCVSKAAQTVRRRGRVAEFSGLPSTARQQLECMAVYQRPLDETAAIIQALAGALGCRCKEPYGVFKELLSAESAQANLCCLGLARLRTGTRPSTLEAELLDVANRALASAACELPPRVLLASCKRQRAMQDVSHGNNLSPVLSDMSRPFQQLQHQTGELSMSTHCLVSGGADRGPCSGFWCATW
jgi:hypothetical protein